MDGVDIGRYRCSCGYGCEIEKPCHAELGGFSALPVWVGMSQSPRNSSVLFLALERRRVSLFPLK